MKLSIIHYVDSRSSSRCSSAHGKMDPGRESWNCNLWKREKEREDCTNRTWIIFHPLHPISFSLLLIFNDGKYEWNEWKCGGVDIKYFIFSRFSFNYCTRWISPSEMCKLKMMLTKRIIFFFLLPFHFAPGSLHRIKTRVYVCVCLNYAGKWIIYRKFHISLSHNASGIKEVGKRCALILNFDTSNVSSYSLPPHTSR